MRELNVGSLGGLYYELYDLSPGKRDVFEILQIEAGNEEAGIPAFLDLNGSFWSEILSPEAVRGMLEELRLIIDGQADCPMYFRIPAENPDLFVSRLERAKSQLFEQSQTEISFYRQIETLAVFCKIYSYLHGFGYELTLHEGFLLDGFSSVQLIRDCLLDYKNPYLGFLKEKAWPKIAEYRPECVWINGRMSLANMAVIRFVRQKFPQTCIFWAGEASEYYATNKIAEYLKCNEPLCVWFIDKVHGKKILYKRKCRKQNHFNQTERIFSRCNHIGQTDRGWGSMRNSLRRCMK